MINFVIFQSSTGKIVQSGSAIDIASVKSLLFPGQGAMEVADVIDNTKWAVIGGRVEPLPDSPSAHHVFDYEMKKWVDPRTLDSLQFDVHAAIARWRDTQESEGMFFEHAGRRWDGGLIVRQRLQPVLGLPALPKGFFWTDASNEDVPMDMPTLQALAVAHEQALVLRGFEIHARQRAMKAEIAAMGRAELLGFVPGWPPEI